MAIEAPISKYRKNGLKMWIVACLAGGIWLAYDGYFNKKFIEEHSLTGTHDTTLVVNRKAPPFAFGAAIVLAFYYWAAKDKKIVADEKELKISGSDSIAYDKIEAIDKTQFASKGYFVVSYKDWKDRPATLKLSDRKWDNLAAVMDMLVEKLQS